jgi:hypothetical protein
MPPQLRNCIRPRKSKRPIAETLPSICVHELRIPRNCQTHILPNCSLRWPYLASVRVSCAAVEFTLPSLHRGREGAVKTFKLKPIFTGLGIRYAFICECGRAVLKLYCVNRQLGCRRCCGARYASQTLDKRDRPILQASRIASVLDNAPRLFRRTRERLLKKLGQKVMMAQRMR